MQGSTEEFQMIWIGISIAVVAAALMAIVGRRLARRRRRSAAQPVDAVDPLFTIGIVIAGTGGALATTLGSVMFGVMAVGLILMAVGATRTRRQPHH